MPNQRDIPALGGRGPGMGGANTPLRGGSTNVGLGVGRGLGPAQTRKTSQDRITAIKEALRNKKS